MVEAGTVWRLEGTVLIACNCDWGCPCNFNARPTQGQCEGGWIWHVDEGRFGDVSLDGLNLAVYVQWPGAIHEGNGTAVVLVDERSDPEQREALAELCRGNLGGPWGILAWTWPTVHGPLPVPFDLHLDGVRSRVKIGDVVELESEPIRNPVTGNEVHPGMVLPEGIIVRRGDLGSSKRFEVRDSIAYAHTGKYTAVGPFAYAGP